MQKLTAASAAQLAGVVGCGLMLILGIGDSTAALLGAAVAVTGWSAVMDHGKA